jgi:hypothetical protein
VLPLRPGLNPASHPHAGLTFGSLLQSIQRQQWKALLSHSIDSDGATLRSTWPWVMCDSGEPIYGGDIVRAIWVATDLFRGTRTCHCIRSDSTNMTAYRQRLRSVLIISWATHLSSAGSYSAPGAIAAKPQQVLITPLGTTRNCAPVGACVMRSQSTLNCSALTFFGLMHRQCMKGAKVAVQDGCVIDILSKV